MWMLCPGNSPIEKIQNFFKGPVMQIEKAMINDRLRVSKVPWKLRIIIIILQ